MSNQESQLEFPPEALEPKAVEVERPLVNRDGLYKDEPVLPVEITMDGPRQRWREQGTMEDFGKSKRKPRV